MAIEKGSVVTAADINAYNTTLATSSNSLKGKRLSSDDAEFTLSIAPRNSYSLAVNFGVSFTDETYIEIKEGGTLMFKWESGVDDPEVNVDSWDYFKDGEDHEAKISAPEGSYIIKLITKGSVGYKPWTISYIAYQAQNNNAVGAVIKKWNTTWSAFEVGGKLSTTEADGGWFGSE